MCFKLDQLGSEYNLQKVNGTVFFIRMNTLKFYHNIHYEIKMIYVNKLKITSSMQKTGGVLVM